MSVATRNPFALLDSEDASRPSTPPVANKTAPQSSSATTRGTQKSTRGGPASRGGKYYARGAKSTSNPNQPTAEEPVTENQRKTEGGYRGRGRGSGGGGGGGGRGGGTRGGRRPFDRHSQTGKIDSDKKLHQGWGGDEGNAELKQEEAAANDAATEANPDAAAAATTAPEGTDAARDDKGEGRPRREREPEEEDTTLTLDQYLAQKKEQEGNLPKIEGTRQANDGAGDDLWKGATVLSKTEEDASYFVGKTKNAPKARGKKEEKVFLEINAHFDRPDRGGRGRGRGGDRPPVRGTRGRGGPRGGRQNGGSAPVDVADEAAFPSLS